MQTCDILVLFVFNKLTQLLNKDQGLFSYSLADTVTESKSYVKMSHVDRNGYSLITFAKRGEACS